MSISVTALASVPPEGRAFEVVERKGLGHPDTLCDMIAERASQLYARWCVKHLGNIAHHWFDKVVLIGGESDTDFGRGVLLRPYQVIFAGKAVCEVGDLKVPLADILRRAASTVLTEHLCGFDPERDLEVDVRVRSSRGPGQPAGRYRPQSKSELQRIGERQLVSNDCNVCVGFAPLTRLEQLVLNTDRFLRSSELRSAHEGLGSDLKMVGTRLGDRYHLLINIPMLARQVVSFEDYTQKCDRLLAAIRTWADAEFGHPLEITLNPERRWRRAYLTATGSVADTGDVGVTGRGNRASGLITPMRPMSIEAAAGKNPLDHSGKLYTVLAARLADEIATRTDGNTTVTIATSKGAPLSEPDAVLVEAERLDEPREAEVRSMVRQALARIEDISRGFLAGDIPLW